MTYRHNLVFPHQVDIVRRNGKAENHPIIRSGSGQKRVMKKTEVDDQVDEIKGREKGQLIRKVVINSKLQISKLFSRTKFIILYHCRILV